MRVLALPSEAESLARRRSSFEDDLRQCLFLGMRDAQGDVFHAKLLGDFLRFTGQLQRWPTAFFAPDFQVHPAHAAPPAGPQRFHSRFFCREASRVAFVLVLELFAVFPLFLRVDASQKGFPAALDRRSDALHFGNVYAHPNDQEASSNPRLAHINPVQPCRPAPIILGRAAMPTKTAKTRRTARLEGSGRSSGSKGWTERKGAGLRILQASALTKIPWLVHGFSTRPGGVSDLAGEKVLNLSFAEWDTRENVLENRRRFQSALGAEGLTLCGLSQIHSDVVRLFAAPPAAPCRGDASTTNRPGLLLAVQTADCVPILLVDPKSRAVAAVHAGWRGTLQRIVTKAIGKMQMQFGTKPADLVAAIGPSIGGCCYEVGTEVAAEFRSQFSNASEWFDELRTGDEPNPLQWLNMKPPGHQPPPKNVLLDLRKANRAQLLEAGLNARNIFVSDLCTACRRDLLFSYRKEGGTTGRLMAVIGIRNDWHAI
jgi:purine-nucleoside/S-methyl-5'-thioadenosine phosphorylase / adenosine deaminase